MSNFIKELNMQVLFFILLIGVLFLIFRDWSSEEEKATRTQLSTWAEKLDRRVKPSGVYIKWESDTLPENDAWGTPIKVDYKNEGVAERLFVTSAGKDKIWGTADDLRVSRMQINAAGIGEGIKEHTSEIAKEAAKGVAEGAKEEISKVVEVTKEDVSEATTVAKEKALNFMQEMKNKVTGAEQE